MKFSVSSSALLSLLATTGKVISNKNTLPILDYFLMELSGSELKVTTSDLETTLVGSIAVESVESEGTIAAPAKLMLDSLKEFPEMPLTVDVNDQNWEIKNQLEERLALHPGSQRCELSCRAAAERGEKGTEDGRRHAGGGHQQDDIRERPTMNCVP